MVTYMPVVVWAGITKSVTSTGVGMFNPCGVMVVCETRVHAVSSVSNVLNVPVFL